MNQEIFKRLRNILANLYPDEFSIRRIIEDAGMDSARIALNSSAINQWDSVLKEAENTNRLDKLLNVIEAEYGSNTELSGVCAAYRHLAKKEISSSSNHKPLQSKKLWGILAGLSAVLVYIAPLVGGLNDGWSLWDRLRGTPTTIPTPIIATPIRTTQESNLPTQTATFIPKPTTTFTPIPINTPTLSLDQRCGVTLPKPPAMLNRVSPLPHSGVNSSICPEVQTFISRYMANSLEVLARALSEQNSSLAEKAYAGEVLQAVQEGIQVMLDNKLDTEIGFDYSSGKITDIRVISDSLIEVDIRINTSVKGVIILDQPAIDETRELSDTIQIEKVNGDWLITAGFETLTGG